MVTITSVFLGFLVALASAKPHARSGMIVRSSKSDAPEGFVRQGAAPADESIPLRIALLQSDMAGLEKALYDVSTPSCPNYGKHLSKEQVEAYVKPAKASIDAVNAFLESNGVNSTTLSPAGDWLGFSVPVSKANEMFDADFSIYKHAITGQESIRTLSYSIPSFLQRHLDIVHPTTTFTVGNGSLPLKFVPLKNGSATNGSQTADLSCNSIITPACIQDLYGVPTALATQSSNQIAVAGYGEQYAQQADLTSFLAALRPDLHSDTTFTVDLIDDGLNPQGAEHAGGEANLDIQYTVGVAQGVPATFISTGKQTNDGFGGFLDMVNFLLGMDPLPQVLTTSYGYDETGLDVRLVTNLCNAYMQLGVRGTSILFASGDGGVSGIQSHSCTSFAPTFPSTCPFVTSVGGTQGSPETSASLSGGGFSNIFSPPSYQSSAVSDYLNSIGSTNSGLFNVSGRGFPDVAAPAVNVEIYNAGTPGYVAGTSCAAPIFASIIALLNDELIAAGKNPLGFINPLLYANPNAFNDITSGDNPGCNTNGFPASSGWDPVTGLGSPKYSALRTAAGL